MILSKIKTLTNIYLNRDNQNISAVITIPAYFNDAQRNATQNAAKIAGINCIRMINEPTAAALAYGILGNKSDEERNIIVYDMGGGTLDVSLLNIDEGIFEVLATTGNSYLGGEDFTKEIYTYCVNTFKHDNEINNQQKIKIHQYKLKELKEKCEEAKINLSYLDKTEIKVSNFWGSVDLNIELTQAKFQEISQELLSKALEPVHEIMEVDHGISKDEITDVLLVGGSTKIPVIQFMLHNYFNIKPSFSNNPDYIVASGAAIQGHLLTSKTNPFSDEIVLVDVIPLSLGVSTMNGVFTPIIERNTTIPVKKVERFTTDTDNETEIEIKIYEGERKLVKDNNLIGSFILSNIEKAKKGVPIIEISLNVDVNGIINVTAKDIRSKSTNKITIINDKDRLTKEEIDELVKEAEEMQKSDYEKKVNIEKKNELYQISNLILENLSNPEVKITKSDKKIISNELKNILTQIESLNNQHLLKKISILKKKYASLILDTSDNLNELETYEETNVTFSDLNGDNKNIPSVQMFNDNKTNDSNIDLAKEEFSGHINSIWKELNSTKDQDFLNYLEEIVMWINITPNLNNLDIESKKKELEIKYNNYIKSKSESKNYKKELYDLCKLLLNDINNHQLPIANNYSEDLKNILINDIIPWMQNNKLKEDDPLLLQKMDFINLKCQEFFDLSN